MDIEIGDYVRSKNGSIGKVTKIEDDKYLYENKELITFIGNVVNHSKNVIDLIEVGDFLNGYRVLETFKFHNDIYVFTTCKSDFKSICRIWSEEDIETILTKEQYQANCYTVKRS